MLSFPGRKAIIANIYIGLACAGSIVEYKLKPSHKIVEELRQLSQKYPDLVSLSTAQEEFNLPTVGTQNDCTFDSDVEGCRNYFITLFDSKAHPKESESFKTIPEVFLSGALHGNERVSANRREILLS